MTFLLFAVGVALIGLVAVLVALPLLSTRPRAGQTAWPPVPAADRAGEWEKQKIDAYTAIKEAEFDRQMGKLTEEDYRVIREKYEARAVEALAQLDALGKPARD